MDTETKQSPPPRVPSAEARQRKQLEKRIGELEVDVALGASEEFNRWIRREVRSARRRVVAAALNDFSLYDRAKASGILLHLTSTRRRLRRAAGELAKARKQLEGTSERIERQQRPRGRDAFFPGLDE